MKFQESKSTIENAFGWRVGLLSLVMVFALFVASSCGGSLSPRNGGFPKKVSISAEGGTKVVKGTTDFYALGIRRWNGDTQGCECDEEGSKMYAKMLWLKAKFNKRTGELTIIAEPNTQGKKRRLIIDGMVMDSMVDIEVHQGK